MTTTTNSIDQEDADQLLLDIFRCQRPSVILEGTFKSGLQSACRKIVDAQFSDQRSSISNIESWHRPEPWSGPLKSAKLLFLSSNPSFSHDELYPTGGSADGHILRFFNRRFSDPEFTHDLRPARQNGGFNRPVKYWREIERLSRELLPEEVESRLKSGSVCLAEVVHCKSRGEVGVAEAAEVCQQAYLSRMLRAAAASVIVVVGSHAAKLIRSHFHIPADVNIWPERVTGRLVAFSAHPEAWRKEGGLKSQWDSRPEEWQQLLRALRLNRPGFE
jgi:hypothetical protein